MVSISCHVYVYCAKTVVRTVYGNSNHGPREGRPGPPSNTSGGGIHVIGPS